MQKFINTYLKGDSVVWSVYFIMVILSTLTMYSASSSLAHQASSFYMPVWKHFCFLMGGAVVIFVLHRIPIKYILGFIRPLYAISLVLLFITPLCGVSRNGATRWLNIMGIEFQPSELVKVFTILFLAIILSDYQNRKDRTPDDGIFRYLLVLGLPSAIIAMDNLSTALLLMTIGFLMMFYAGISWKLIGKITLVVLMIGGIFFTAIMLSPEESAESEDDIALVTTVKKVTHRTLTWKHRINSFFEEPQPHDENYKITDYHYQEDRAKIAVANGKWFGVGIGNSVQRDFLPLAYADFIFALMIEEVGLLSIAVLILYVIFMFRVGHFVQYECNSICQTLIVLGLTTMIMVQTIINVFIAVGLFPVSGQPLPFFSRGGTSILITSSYFGIILCIMRTQMELNEKKKENNKSKQENNDTSEEETSTPLNVTEDVQCNND